MKIYFTAALTSIPAAQKEQYKEIVAVLKDLGHRVNADNVFGRTASLAESKSEEEAVAAHRKMIAWKHQAEILVIEGSYPSISVGQELSYALANNKPVILLYIKGKKPHVLRAVGTEYLHLVEYSPDKLKAQLNDYIEYAKDTADTRFNFFISPQIETFLDWIAKKRKVPRAVFLRELIEEDMSKNKKYLGQIGKNNKERASS